MRATETATMLRIHISEADRFGETALYEAIVRRCRECGIGGATVFRGIEGYGETAEIHRKHLVTSDRPIVVVIVDSEANIERVLPALEDMLENGTIASSAVEMRRVGNGDGR